ncbi:MAG: ABC transporter permease [Candidatus Eremiobacteraeota bacterium]|nr:ABC transporter permease [Candidatus Eremiobacteraeota bacterium]
MSTLSILAAREYTSRLKSKGFIIGTIFGVIGIIGLSFISAVGSWLFGTFSTSIALVGPDRTLTQSLAHELRNDYKVTVQPYTSKGPEIEPALKANVVNGKYDAALIAYRQRDGSLGFAYYPVKSASLEDQQSLKRKLLKTVVAADFKGANLSAAQRVMNFPFSTVNLNPRYKTAAEAGLAQGLVYFLLLLLYIAVIMYGVYVGSGVVEEKSNRVMEIMIGAVRPGQLLAGKILGIGALALTQMLIFGLAAGSMLVLVGLHMASSIQTATPAPAGTQSAALAIATVPLSMIVYLIVFFILGFFSYATLFAGVGALASKAEDVQSSNGPLVFPIVIAYMLSIFALQDPDKPLFVWASLVPLVSPMLMFTRVATSTVPVWQIATSIGLSVLCIWGFTLLAAKLYRVGVLMYGKPLSPKEILRALRAPT